MEKRADHDMLAMAVAESQSILSRHDGIHLLHNDCQALIFMQKAALRGLIVRADSVDVIIKRMRTTDQTGIYPSEGHV